jgi:homoserine kinase
MTSITVNAPATVANLGSGFDLIGLAIEQVADEITLTKRSDSKVLIQNIIGDNGMLPRETEANTCTVAIKALLEKLDSQQGFDVVIKKHIAFNSGLGSSASSAVAGVFAANELLGKPLSKTELIWPALHGEYVASKGYHADNVAPCMLGGITFIQDLDPLTIESVAYNSDVHIVVLYQFVSVSTSEARAILPQSYERKTLTRQSSRIASLLFGLSNNNEKYLEFGLGDEIATPYRKKLIPFFDELSEIAFKNNATGFNISGSGPSVFAWCSKKEIADKIKTDWSDFFYAANKPYEVYSLAINNRGVEIKQL